MTTNLDVVMLNTVLCYYFEYICMFIIYHPQYNNFRAELFNIKYTIMKIKCFFIKTYRYSKNAAMRITSEKLGYGMMSGQMEIVDRNKTSFVFKYHLI